LAKAVIRLLDDESLARRLGEEGSIWVRENFSFESMIKKTEELYEDLLEEKRRTFA
jgi:glycosyltransferase involved in cell wall biosynthesis